MKHSVLAATAALLATSAGAQTIEVGNANWSRMPPLKMTNNALPIPEMTEQVHAMLKTGQCKLKKQSAQRFDITVPYAVLVEPDGSTNRILVADIGCKPLEMLVGRVASERATLRRYRLTGESKARWYSDEMNFSYE